MPRKEAKQRVTPGRGHTAPHFLAFSRPFTNATQESPLLGSHLGMAGTMVVDRGTHLKRPQWWVALER